MAQTRIDVRRVLCPVDFSDFSIRALEHAVRVASFFEATVHVLHVVPPLLERIDEVQMGPSGAPEGPRQMALRELAAFAQPFNEWHVPIELSVTGGNPAREIERIAEELPADIVVMGTHGRKGLAHLVVGSVTERVMHRVACPVLTVGARQTSPPSAPPYRRILCPTTLMPGSEHSLDFALALAAQNEALLEVLHVIDDRPAGAEGPSPFEGAPGFEGLRTRLVAEADAELRQAIPSDRRNSASVRRRIATGDAALAILEAARTGRADVIVMGARAGAVDRALFGSTIQRVLREASCAVLVLGRSRAVRPADERAAHIAPPAR